MGAHHRDLRPARQGRRAGLPAEAGGVSAQRETIELFGRCLALRLDPPQPTSLRARALSSAGLWSELTDFALEEGLVLALEQSLRARGLLLRSFSRRIRGSSAPT